MAQDLNLSNILPKHQHYLLEKNQRNLDFQLQPITHNLNKKNQSSDKVTYTHKNPKQRREQLEQQQKIRKQLLLQKISAKNQKYQLWQKTQKQNKNSTQNHIHQTNKKPKNIEKSSNIINFNETKQSNRQNDASVKKICVKSSKHFSSTKGFNLKNYKSIQKIDDLNNHGSKHQKSMQIKPLKLPELNSAQTKINKQQNNHKNRESDQVQLSDKDLQTLQQLQNKAKYQNLILKTTDVRFFGIEQRQQKYQKMGKQLLKFIKTKYWCYDSLDHEQVYENFQNFLNQQFL